VSDEAELKLEMANPVPTEGGKILFESCHLAVKDGHIVAECDTIEASQELAVLLMEDVFIRVKPKAPVAEPTEVAQPTEVEAT